VCLDWSEPRAAGLAALFGAASDEPLDTAAAQLRAFRLRLAAHHATVATFVPTDVDAHIRHHAWAALAEPASVIAARALVDEAAARDARVVSQRVTARVEKRLRAVSAAVDPGGKRKRGSVCTDPRFAASNAV
jgi:hypothetical protein